MRFYEKLRGKKDIAYAALPNKQQLTRSKGMQVFSILFLPFQFIFGNFFLSCLLQFIQKGYDAKRPELQQTSSDNCKSLHFFVYTDSFSTFIKFMSCEDV